MNRADEKAEKGIEKRWQQNAETQMGNHQDDDGSPHDVAEKTKGDGDNLCQLPDQVQGHHDEKRLEILLGVILDPLAFDADIMGDDKTQDAEAQWGVQILGGLLEMGNDADPVTQHQKHEKGYCQWGIGFRQFFPQGIFGQIVQLGNEQFAKHLHGFWHHAPLAGAEDAEQDE
ncbi:hypothetical protein DESC_730101 [Desulfosarcina cetonica]|nr:hypothetical protein DESC_730101 [Desulfosarcina cetonica]